MQQNMINIGNNRYILIFYNWKRFQLAILTIDKLGAEVLVPVCKDDISSTEEGVISHRLAPYAAVDSDCSCLAFNENFRL